MDEEIKNLIKQKKNDLDEQSLLYFTNYFYVLIKNKLLPLNVELSDVIDNTLRYANKIEFYDENHRVYLTYGEDVKGYRDPETKTIYIRNNLSDPLREITVYHEIHHAAQTNPENDMVGTNQETNIGRLIMEAQTQYFAELVYQEIHNVKFEDKEIPSENLRMLAGGTVTSNLHNYELYDNLLSKLSIILNLPKDYFVTINFLYKGNLGLKELRQKYNEVKEKQKYKINFEYLLYILDYIYCVDLLAYKKNDDKDVILSGQETKCSYIIHPDKPELKLSLKRQREFINYLDVEYFLSLTTNKEIANYFATYVIDNEKRNIINNFMNSTNKS